MKPKYVAGFLFNKACDKVILIRKNKPDWQKGKLNGIGGYIEKGEIPKDAMIREFREETSVQVLEWELFVHLYDKRQYRVAFFYAIDEKAFHSAYSITDELIYKVLVENIPKLSIIPNLQWLVPMALSMKDEKDIIFEVIEKEKI